MKTTITTYDPNGKEVITRDYQFDGSEKFESLGELLFNQISDTRDYLSEAHDCGKDNVDADGTCLTCGKTDLI